MASFLAGIRELHIDGPYASEGIARDTPSRRAIFSCDPGGVAEERPFAEEILTRTARRAYRRPVGTAEVADLLEFFDAGRAEGGTFDHGVQFALERVLSDPSFLLRVYREPGGEDPYPLSDLEVASRLSFFLWSSVPDDELLTLAEEGRLTERAELRQQVDRMRRDPRTLDALIHDFTNQWLTLGLLKDRTVRDRLYNDYDLNLRDAMKRETELFVASTILEDRSVLDLLRADYTYLNERLAQAR